jgi:hypothetical protein
MWMECFAGDVRIEADDADMLAERFVQHAADHHDWSYPDQALRGTLNRFVLAGLLDESPADYLVSEVDRLPP